MCDIHNNNNNNNNHVRIDPGRTVTDISTRTSASIAQPLTFTELVVGKRVTISLEMKYEKNKLIPIKQAKCTHYTR